ncbi:MAG: hypothetical protein QS98_C0003G0091 [archaeon GW2011_AR3]|nr:MAG: hypothetical protein QS98_C0003G0091 [archaeon GW2011_AR3]MBS3110133.1 twin-arginine translocation signal domain-containing protein [Candidatus Woesearchaeota archaeon]
MATRTNYDASRRDFLKAMAVLGSGAIASGCSAVDLTRMVQGANAIGAGRVDFRKAKADSTPAIRQLFIDDVLAGYYTIGTKPKSVASVRYSELSDRGETRVNAYDLPDLSFIKVVGEKAGELGTGIKSRLYVTPNAFGQLVQNENDFFGHLKYAYNLAEQLYSNLDGIEWGEVIKTLGTDNRYTLNNLRGLAAAVAQYRDASNTAWSKTNEHIVDFNYLSRYFGLISDNGVSQTGKEDFARKYFNPYFFERFDELEQSGVAYKLIKKEGVYHIEKNGNAVPLPASVQGLVKKS